MRLLRYWYYFRIGYGVYISFILGTLSTITILYELALKNVPWLSELHLWGFSILVSLVGTPFCLFLGWVHVRKQMKIDNDIGTIANPYISRILPGKEKDVYVPLMLLNLEISETYLRKSGAMTPQLEYEIGLARAKVNRLLQS